MEWCTAKRDRLQEGMEYGRRYKGRKIDEKHMTERKIIRLADRQRRRNTVRENNNRRKNLRETERERKKLRKGRQPDRQKGKNKYNKR
jgi:hypothetical protein